MIKWNNKTKLIISDVDETIADLYTKAEPEMISELAKLLREGKSLFFISGQSIQSINWRIVEHLPEELPTGYNIQIWDGEKELHHGTLEFFQSRQN